MAITGFVTTKNGKYYAVLNLHDENGKRKQKWFSTDLPLRGNKRNAEKILRDLIDEWEGKEAPYCRLLGEVDQAGRSEHQTQHLPHLSGYGSESHLAIL